MPPLPPDLGSLRDPYGQPLRCLPSSTPGFPRLEGASGEVLLADQDVPLPEWRPRGVLVTQLHEHAGSVNTISVAQVRSTCLIVLMVIVIVLLF